MHDLGDLLGGGDAVGDLAANRALAHRGHEVARHPEVDVGFQQGHADFAQGGVDVALAKAAASAEVAKYAGEPLGQTFKHRVFGRCAGIRRLYGARVAGQSTARFRSIGSVGGRSARGIRLAAQDTALSRRRSRVRIPHALPKRSAARRPGCSSEPGESSRASRDEQFEALDTRVPSCGGHQARDFRSQPRSGVSARRQEAGPPPGFLVWEASEAGQFGDGAA